MERQLQAIVTLLALVNPMMCAAIFLKVAGSLPPRSRWLFATRGAVAVLVILVLAALAGAQVLHAFGVSLDAFSVAGGGVLAWIGFSMLSGDSGSKAPESPGSNPRPSLSPLIMFAASPGTITGVITLAVAHSKLGLPTTALVAVAVAVVAMWLVIVLGIVLSGRPRKEEKSGGGLVRDTTTRFMGLIVIAMGVQFALTGIRSFFEGPVSP